MSKAEFKRIMDALDKLIYVSLERKTSTCEHTLTMKDLGYIRMTRSRINSVITECEKIKMKVTYDEAKKSFNVTFDIHTVVMNVNQSCVYLHHFGLNRVA